MHVGTGIASSKQHIVEKKALNLAPGLFPLTSTTEGTHFITNFGEYRSFPMIYQV